MSHPQEPLCPRCGVHPLGCWCPAPRVPLPPMIDAMVRNMTEDQRAEFEKRRREIERRHARGMMNAIVTPSPREIVSANYEASLRKRAAIIEAILDRGLA